MSNSLEPVPLDATQLTPPFTRVRLEHVAYSPSLSTRAQLFTGPFVPEAAILTRASVTTCDKGKGIAVEDVSGKEIYPSQPSSDGTSSSWSSPDVQSKPSMSRGAMFRCGVNFGDLEVDIEDEDFDTP